MKILIADDSQLIRVYLTKMLNGLGHEVVQTTDGLEAWAAIEKEYFPVVITDWQMPRLDGLGLCAMIRARPADKYSYVILITAHGAAENYAAGIKAGADDFLQKPCDENYLAARLLVAQRIVAMQNHTRQLESLMSVCSYCKNIRTQGDHWVSMEKYASQQFGVTSSHGICPTCFRDCVKPELARFGIKTDGAALQ